jgi:putative photosynthetic complex assembly protein 2
MIGGMVQRGYEPDFAQRCFNQIKGFGDYGFPESHAQAFAHLAYVSAWLKCHHPAAFTCALLIWGWHELSFLTGWITGPRRRAAAPGAKGWLRFVQATQAILWHEIAILLVGLLIVALTWGQPNQVGTWTFLVLWSMRTSAKLNLFLGVRNLSEEFLPPHLAYLQSFFRKRPMNVLFPVSVSVSTAVAAMMVSAALDAAPAASAGLMLVASMLCLAIVEHWLLVLPLPATALWRWAMRKRDAASPVAPPAIAPDSEDILLHAP